MEMICQMSSGTAGFGFHSSFIAVAGVWYIKHQRSLSWRQTTPTLAPVIREITAYTFQIIQPHLGKTEMTKVQNLC